jgi:hypothetical protein
MNRLWHTRQGNVIESKYHGGLSAKWYGIKKIISETKSFDLNRKESIAQHLRLLENPVLPMCKNTSLGVGQVYPETWMAGLSQYCTLPA